MRQTVTQRHLHGCTKHCTVKCTTPPAILSRTKRTRWTRSLPTARDGFSAVGKLRSEEAFRAFMMKTLCARIKSRLREYADEGRQPLPSSDGFDVMVEFSRMSDTERIIGSMYIGGKFQPDEITAYTGFSSATIKKTIDRVVTEFELD